VPTAYRNRVPPSRHSDCPVIPSSMSVWNGPGQIACTVTPRAPVSSATHLVIPTRACFDPLYALRFGDAHFAAVDATLMMRPWPRSSICGSSACMSEIAPKRLTRIARSKSASA
jgi:hypothetical protein